MLNHKSVKYFKQAVNATAYVEHNNDIACKCPICGDSKKNRNSKRLHLYNKGNADTDFVSCFNGGCSVQNKTVYSFLRDFYPELLPAYKRETFQTKIESMRPLSSLSENKIDWANSEIATNVENAGTNETESFGKLEQSTAIADWTNSDVIGNTKQTQELYTGPTLYDLTPYFKPLTTEQEAYLENRSIKPHFNGTWYCANQSIKIGETTYNIKDYLIIPLTKDNLMYGFYSRSITDKKFITFVSTIGYKVWNWYNIDKSEPCYIFEAIFDGMSTGLTNIVANLGANIPEDRLKELENPIFCLDNDRTGLENSIKYAMQGHSVYVQPAHYIEKDFNELKLNNPGLDIIKLIQDNTFKGISAVTRIKAKL